LIVTDIEAGQVGAEAGLVVRGALSATSHACVQFLSAIAKYTTPATPSKPSATFQLLSSF